MPANLQEPGEVSTSRSLLRGHEEPDPSGSSPAPLVTAPREEQAAAAETRAARRYRIERLARASLPYLGFILIFAFFSITLRTHGFDTVGNLKSIVEQSAPIAIMAMGYTFTLGAGEIDLSIGSTVALVALITALVLQYEPAWVGVLAGLGIGLGVGLTNGLLTVFLRVPSFLITLGMTSVLLGVAEALTNLQAVAVQNNAYNGIFGSGSAGPIPSLLIWVVAVLVVGHVALRRTRYGLHLLSVGASRDAALSLGLWVKSLRVAALCISALTAALAGLLYTGRLQGATYTLGSTDLLTVIAAAIIGGTSLFGGRSSVPGSLVGALLLGMLAEGLILMGLTVPAQLIVEGAVDVVAVALGLRAPAE
ncbi:MAG: ABC transporter permease [Actinomycetota bacterium]|nr:ABC transporter permease [Actinomycetota bacterium]